MATPEMLQPAVQLIELDQDRLHLHKANKLGIRQDVSSIFGKKYKPKIIISTPASGPAGEGGAQGGNDSPRPFACMFCPAAFKSETSLVSHVRVHVTSGGAGLGAGGGKQIVHSCVYCNRSFKQATNLEIHVRTYHPYGDGSGGPQQLNNYNMNQAALNASYMMNQALWEYKNQEQQHQGEGNSGEGQNRGADNNSHELSSQVQVKQEKGTTPQQFDAGGGTVSWEKVSRDLSTAYAVERPFTCDYCSKCFKQEAHLKQHVRIHTDDRPYGCSYCGKAFRQKAVLNQHVRLHTGEKPYTCQHCGDRFRQMTTLKLHTRKHLCEVVASGSLVGSGYRDIIRIMKGAGIPGGGGGGTGPPLSEHEEAANVLSAQIAQMQAAAGGGHANGMPKGPGRCGGNVGRPRGSHRPPDTLYYLERPYTCAHCAKCFKQEAHLKLHERTHSDYRPFACGYCGKAFRLKAILQQHERLHTGEKPYACGTCGESFRQMTTLKLHARKHEVELALARAAATHSSGDGENQCAVSHSGGEGENLDEAGEATPSCVVVMQNGDASDEGVNV